jgi:hypothetical protein
MAAENSHIEVYQLLLRCKQSAEGYESSPLASEVRPYKTAPDATTASLRPLAASVISYGRSAAQPCGQPLSTGVCTLLPPPRLARLGGEPVRLASPPARRDTCP